jgi:hypothetical protein
MQHAQVVIGGCRRVDTGDSTPFAVHVMEGIEYGAVVIVVDRESYQTRVVDTQSTVKRLKLRDWRFHWAVRVQGMQRELVLVDHMDVTVPST